MDGASILWTALPMELVIEGLTEGQAPGPCMEMSVGGRLLLVHPAENGMGRVERLISGNADDYLDARFQPGCMVPLYTQGSRTQ